MLHLYQLKSEMKTRYILLNINKDELHIFLDCVDDVGDDLQSVEAK